MAPNAASRKDVRRMEKESIASAAADAAVLRNILSTIEGRAWMWRLLGTCHVFTTSFTGDALTSAFAEGERNIGQRLLNSITDNCPDAFIQAMRESYERSATSERRSSPEPDGGDSGREHTSGDAPEHAPDTGVNAPEEPGWPNLIDDSELLRAAQDSGTQTH